MTTTSTSTLDAVLDASYRLPTGVSVDSILEPLREPGEHVVTLLDRLSGNRQVVKIPAFTPCAMVGRILHENASSMLGRAASKPTRKKG